MRGTLPPLPVAIMSGGITPAHAGNTERCERKAGKPRDHPRTCGEHPGRRRTVCPPRGSPPHMRGTLSDASKTACTGGITPAHAGNTGSEWLLNFFHGDHPRTCGEHASYHQNNIFMLGSPPHMRGTLCDGQPLEMVPRITPAHAGNTLIYTFIISRFQDHPRTCGEHACGLLDRNGFIGSPPHMRGTLR